MAGSSAYSEAVSKAKAEAAARGQLGPLDPGGANEYTVGGGDDDGQRRQEFSQTVADATLGVDGEGDKPGAPGGQMEDNPEIFGQEPPMSKSDKSFQYFAKAEKVSHGVVFGWAIICKQDDGAGDGRYFDVQKDHIPEDSMLDAAVDFCAGARPGNEMHAGPDIGQHIFVFPMTSEITKALGLETKKTGLIVGYKPPPDVLAKFESGEYTGFSIEGTRINDVEEDDGQA